MKFFLVLLTILVLIAGCNDEETRPPIERPDPGRHEIFMLTFNINGGNTLKEDYIDRITNLIRNADADIVALQEVDFMTKGSGFKDIATELGVRLGMAPIFGKSYTFDEGSLGVAILSQWSLYEIKVIPLPPYSGEEKYSALLATLSISETDTISVISTRFSADENTRNNQIEALNNYISNIHYPSLLAGDFNALPNSKSLQILEERWTPTYDKEELRPTYPANNPEQKIDYVMFKPQDQWSALFRLTRIDVEVSDHCAYLAIMGLK